MDAHTTALYARFTRTRTALVLGAAGWLTERLVLFMPRMETLIGVALMTTAVLWTVALWLRRRDPPRHPPHPAEGRERDVFPTAWYRTRQVT